MSSDARLARLAAKGDRAAFAAIFDRYHHELYRYCVSIVRDNDDAADALQNTMLRALRALGGDDREIALRPWLYRIAHNESITLLRRPREESGSADLRESLRDVENSAAIRARLATLLDDIRGLPERQRAALVMRELSGLSYAEIGDALESSASGAKQAVYDARRALHELAQGRDASCDSIRRRISDGDGRAVRGRTVRAHLSACTGCRSFQAQIGARERELAGLAPVLPAAAAAKILSGALAGAGGSSGQGMLFGLGTTAVVNSAATVAITVVLGAGVVGPGLADKGGSDGAVRTPVGGTVGTPGSRSAAGGNGIGSGGAQTVGRRSGERASSRGGGSGSATSPGSQSASRKSKRRARIEGVDRDQATAAAPAAPAPSARRGGRLGIRRPGESGGRDNSSGDPGPIRTGVEQVQDTVNGTADGVRDALPVEVPALPGAAERPPR